MKLDPPANEQSAGREDDRQAGGDGEVAPAQAEVEQGRIEAVDDEGQSAFDRSLDRAPGGGHHIGPPFLFRPAVGEVVGQDEEGFYEREEQHRDDDGGNYGHDPPEAPGHRQQREEGGDSGEDSEDDRASDQPRPLDRGIEPSASTVLDPVDALSHDDRIVDDDSQHHDEGEERDHVDRHAEQRHQGDGAEEADRDPEGDPECEAQLEKERKGKEDEDQACPAVADQEIQPASKHLGIILPDRQVQSIRQLQSCGLGFDVASDLLGDVGGVLVADPEHADHDRRLAIEEGLLVGVGEAIPYGADVSNPDAGSIGFCQDGDVREFRAAEGLPLGSQQDLAVACFYRAARQVERGAPHRGRDLVEAQLVSPEGCFGELYGDLVGPGVGELHEADSVDG